MSLRQGLGGTAQHRRSDGSGEDSGRRLEFQVSGYLALRAMGLLKAGPTAGSRLKHPLRWVPGWAGREAPRTEVRGFLSGALGSTSEGGLGEVVAGVGDAAGERGGGDGGG